MAKAKLAFKTPLLPLSWVNVRGVGKLKKDKEDNQSAENYNYTATVTFQTEAEMLKSKEIFDKFWKDNKPQGVGKQKYEMFKPMMVPTLKDGKEQRDADDEVIKHHNGKYTLAAKTSTKWPDGKSNVVKLLGSTGKELQEGHPLERGCGDGTLGILHCTLGINGFSGNEGLQLFLNGIQLKDSSFVEYVGGSEVHADVIDDDVVETTVSDAPEI